MFSVHKSAATLLLCLLCIPVYAQNKALTIDQAVKIALQNSPQIRARAAQTRVSQGALTETNALDNPTLTAELNHVLQGPAVKIDIPDVGTAELSPSSNTTGTARVAMPIDISGKFGLASEISRYQVQLDRLALESAARDLVFNVKRSAYNYLRAKEAQKVAQASVDSAQARLENSRAKFEAGAVPRFDVTRADVELSNFNQQLISSANAVSTARAALNTDLGLPISEPTDIVELEIAVEVPKLDVETLTTEAYARRPDVRSVLTAVEISRKNLQLQRTGTKPSASVVGTYNHNFKASGFSGQKDNWMAVLALSMPIFDGGITKARVDQARAQIDVASENLDQTRLGVGLDVKTATVSVVDSAQRALATRSSVALAEEALRLANVRYDAGISILVEVTDAQSALSQARFNYVNALYDYAVALANMERATASQIEVEPYQENVDTQKPAGENIDG